MACGAAVLALGGASAWAQEGSTEKDGAGASERRAERRRPSEPTTVGEVVVTATKQAVDLQKLPQAVTAITAERLDELNALNFADYFRDVPGLMMDVDDHGHLDFSLRGVTSFLPGAPATTASVGQYINEIPVTATQAQIDMRLVDIERVEVLRGPMGTLYGEGSLGGTIRIVTKRPDLDELSASIEGRISHTEHGGTNDQVSVMLNVPIIQDKLALRANYFNATDSGYIDVIKLHTPVNPPGAPSQILGPYKENANSTDAEGGRIMALFTPTESLKILAEAVTTKSSSGMLSMYMPKFGDLTAVVDCPMRCYYAEQDQRANLYNLTVDYDFGWGALTSASSWTDTKREIDYIAAAAGASVNIPDDITNSNAFVQEVRLVSSPEWSRKWDYVVGAYYSSFESENVGRANVGKYGLPATEENREIALFGEVGYKINDQWGIRVGLRGSNLRQENTVARARNVPPPDNDSAPPPTFDMETFRNTYKPVTGRIVVNYAASDNLLMYGTVSTGFRKGGQNLPSPDPRADDPPPYKPDETVNYELGWKITFPSHKATLNGAIFHIDWKDVQNMGVSATQPAFNYYLNGGDVVVNGIELEGGLEVFKGFNVRASLSYLDAKLAEDFKLQSNPLTYGGRKGDRMPFVAPLSGSLSFSYRHPLGTSGFQAFEILNLQYQGRRTSGYNDEPGNPRGNVFAVMRPYWTTGLQVGVENELWRAALYVDNLFDERAELMRIPSYPPDFNEYQSTNRPRTVGLNIKRNF